MKVLCMSSTEQGALKVFAKWMSHGVDTACIHSVQLSHRDPFLSEWWIHYSTKENDN